VKTNSTGINIGSSSILMIFVVLCLVAFSSLSIVSANSDYLLSQKLAQKTTAYYEACNLAENSLASIDETLQTCYNSSDSKESYFSKTGYSTSFYIPIYELLSLYVEIKPSYPEKNGDLFYTIQSYKVEITGTLEIDDSLPVIN